MHSPQDPVAHEERAHEKERQELTPRPAEKARSTVPGARHLPSTSYQGFVPRTPKHRCCEIRLPPKNLKLDGIGGVTDTSAVVNGVVYFGDWHGVVHLLERHFPVRGGQVDDLAAKR